MWFILGSMELMLTPADIHLQSMIYTYFQADFAW